MADQWAGPVTSWSGHPLIRTPNLDRLANRGVVFQNAYCPSPLCAPSRFSFMSGQLPTRIGAYDNAAEFTSQVPTFAHYLRRMGYRTCLTGKMHFVGADQLHGFEERTTTDVYPADLAWTPDWTRFENRIAWWYHNLLPVKQAGTAEITNQLEYDDEVAHQARQWLYDAARKPERQPFCLVTSFTHPHDPYACRQRYWDLYDHNAIDLPRVGPVPGDQLDAHSQRLRHVSAMDHFEVTEEDVRNARHAYYGGISYLDEQIGALIDILEVTGLADRTVVLFCADHGDMLGERGLWYKMSFFEMSARIPMFVHWPAMFQPRSVDTAVSLLDVLPTLAEFATGDTVDPATFVTDLDGASLAPLMSGGRLARGDRITAEFTAEGSIAPCFMIRDGRFKFIWCETDPPLLFDLEADPDELTNLAADPSDAGIVRSFTGELVSRYDPPALRAKIIHSQKVRLMVADALMQGRYVPWDFQPFQDAAKRFMRNHLDLNELEATSRFPRPREVHPQGLIAPPVSLEDHPALQVSPAERPGSPARPDSRICRASKGGADRRRVAAASSVETDGGPMHDAAEL